jgi:phage terminase small subunit
MKLTSEEISGGLFTKAAWFAREYLVDLNATKAAERAGYSKRTAYSQGQRLLKNVAVRSEIQALMDKRAAKLQITAERVLQELALLGFSNMQDYLEVAPGVVRVDLSKIDRDKFAAVQEVTVEEYVERTGPEASDVEKVKRTKFKLADKRGALVYLGRHLKLFTDKVQVEGELQVEVRDVKQKLLAKLAGARVVAREP